MKKQFYAFLRGLTLAVLIGLLYVYGGFSYIYSQIKTYSTSVNTETVLEVTPQETSTTTEISELAPVMAEDTGTSTELVTNVVATSTVESLPKEMDFLLDGFYTVISGSSTPRDSRPFSSWFTQTAPIEIIAHQYDLDTDANSFCQNSSPILNNLTVRLNDRVEYAKDRQAEQVDQYFVLNQIWLKSDEELSKSEQGSFDLYAETIRTVISSRFAKEKYENFLQEVTSNYTTYTSSRTEVTERFVRELRILRDKRTSAVTNTVTTHESSLKKAIDDAKSACAQNPNTSASVYLQLKKSLSDARAVTQADMTTFNDSDDLAAILSSYEDDMVALRKQLQDQYQVLRSELN